MGEAKMTNIPNINKALDKESLKVIISSNYLNFAPDYMSFLGEWITGTYKAFNDADKYIILGYLFRKTVTFYYENYIKVSYETFYKSAIKLVEPINTMRNLTNVFYLLYKICRKENIINQEINKEAITNVMKQNFTYTWHHYYKFIFTWLYNWKKFFNNDTEKFIIWCIPMLHRANKMRLEKKSPNSNISSWRAEIEKIETQGINTMSLSDITGIPRPTVTRKLKVLIANKHLYIDKNKLIHPGDQGKYKAEMYNIQNIALNEFSDFTAKIFNQIIFRSSSSETK